jgi:hypothetical protein
VGWSAGRSGGAVSGLPVEWGGVTILGFGVPGGFHPQEGSLAVGDGRIGRGVGVLRGGQIVTAVTGRHSKGVTVLWAGKLGFWGKVTPSQQKST